MPSIKDPNKELVAILKAEKPWGRFSQYVHNQPVNVKILELHAGEQLSY